ncbi:MAG: hypothetical protein LLG14_17690 [Nocardiaceae bacterium]|nr:hypothetical protein [Nocardiaceae bacterium]
MSFDLLIVAPTTSDAFQLRGQLLTILKSMESARRDSGPADPRLFAFLGDITDLFADDDLWSVPPQMYAPDWLYLCATWPRAEQVYSGAKRLVERHGLVLFNPQRNTMIQHREKPVRQVTTSRGDVIDDPSEAALGMLFEDIEHAGRGHLIVTSLEDASGNTYAQTKRNDDGSYIVEYRDGAADKHFGTKAPDMRSAHALVAGWAFDVAGWGTQLRGSASGCSAR